MRYGITLLALWAAVAQGQEKPKMAVSLRQAVDVALSPDGSPRVAIAQELIRQSETRQAQARAALLPNVDGSYTFRSFTQNLQSFGLTVQTPIPGFQIPSFVGPVDVNDVRATASQSIFDWSAIRRYQAAKATVSATRSDSQVTRTQTTAQVARAYAAALRARASLATAQANVELGERLRKLALSQKEIGTGTGIEVTRADVQLAANRQSLIQAQLDQESARLQLLRSMGVAMDVELELTDALEYRPIDVPDPVQATTVARQERTELKTQAERERSARLSYQSVKAERLPSVGAFGDYGTIGVVDGSMLPTRTVGVSVRIPVFDGGRRDARRAESGTQLRQEEIRTRDVRQQVDLEVRLAIEGLKSAEAQAKVALEALSLSEKELEQAQRRYEAGVATNLEVTDAQARLVRARENQVGAKYRYQLARIDLSVATGKLDEIF